jgi:hypothetical protein
MLCLPLQTLALQWEPAFAADSVTVSLAHALEHAEHVEHHHEADGSIHYDDSEESAQHMHMHDHLCGAQFCMVDGVPQLTPPSQVGREAWAEPAFHVPNPFLDNPQRPPALALG